MALVLNLLQSPLRISFPLSRSDGTPREVHPRLLTHSLDSTPSVSRWFNKEKAGGSRDPSAGLALASERGTGTWE